MSEAIASGKYGVLAMADLEGVNIQNWCSKWRISINILKTTYILFYDQRKKPKLPPIPLTINGASLNKVSSQRILGITIDNNLSFSPHIENITNKCKRAYNRLTLFPDMLPDLVI